MQTKHRPNLYVVASHLRYRVSTSGARHLAQGHLASTWCYWWTHKLSEEDVTWHDLLTGRGARSPPASCFTGNDRLPAYSPRALTGGPSGLSHLPSNQSNNERAAELIDHRQPSRDVTATSPVLLYSLFRWLCAADSWALCPRRPLLVLQSFNLCEKPAWLHIPESCCITPVFSPLSCFSHTVFFCPGCLTMFVFPSCFSTPPAGGAALFLTRFFMNRSSVKQSREEMLFVFCPSGGLDQRRRILDEPLNSSVSSSRMCAISLVITSLLALSPNTIKTRSWLIKEFLSAHWVL